MRRICHSISTQVWAITGPQREQLGGCIAGLRYLRCDGLQPTDGSGRGGGNSGGAAAEGQRYSYVFERPLPPTGASGTLPEGPPGSSCSSSSSQRQAEGSLLAAGFAEGDMGLLGVEGRHVAAARVTVGEVTEVRCQQPGGRPRQAVLVAGWAGGRIGGRARLCLWLAGAAGCVFPAVLLWL